MTGSGTNGTFGVARGWRHRIEIWIVMAGLGLVVGHLVSMWTLVGVALAALAVVLAVGGVAAIRHEQRVRVLVNSTTESTIDGVAVRLGPLRGTAFVAGIRSPQVYVDTTFLAKLGPAERRAVILHEEAHRRARDPLRLIAVHAWRPILCRFGLGEALVAELMAAREIAADRHALDHGVSRQALARALLRSGPAPGGGASAFRSAIDQRLQVLVGKAQPPAGPVIPALVTSGVGSGVLSCVLFAHVVCLWVLHLVAA